MNSFALLLPPSKRRGQDGGQNLATLKNERFLIYGDNSEPYSLGLIERTINDRTEKTAPSPLKRIKEIRGGVL